MSVAYHNPSARVAPAYESMSLDQLLATPDVVSLHVPLLPDPPPDRSQGVVADEAVGTSSTPREDLSSTKMRWRGPSEGIIKGAGSTY
jgi:hypothetical protein